MLNPVTAMVVRTELSIRFDYTDLANLYVVCDSS